MLPPMAKKLSAAVVTAVALGLVGAMAPVSADSTDTDAKAPTTTIVAKRDTGWGPV